ncbi:MAG: hypothetical protein H0V70_00360 [Ktedonobacteraceae bacterium]|nr:hypothetical protein [Ktedonobacteraceae bacterium]
MSIQPPRIEARVSAQERLQTILHARIEELSEDMFSSFSQQTAYQVGIEQKIDALSDKIDKVEAKIVTLATKEDVATLERRVLDAFQQLLTVIDQRLPPPEK